MFLLSFLSFDWFSLFSSTSNKTTKQISYIKIFLIMCMTCIHISLLSSQCFSVLNSNDSHKRFLSKGFYILFPPLSLIRSLLFWIFLFDMWLFDGMCLWCIWKDQWTALFWLMVQVFLFSLFFVRSYFNITKTLIIKISMLCFLIVRYFWWIR